MHRATTCLLYTTRHFVKLRIFWHWNTLCAPSSNVSVRGLTLTVRRACRRRERRYRRTRDDTDKAAYIASTMHKKHDVLNIKQQQYWSERVATSASNSTLLWRSMMKVLQQDKRPAENLTPTLHDADDFRQFFDEKVMQVGVSLHQHPRQRRRFLSHLVAGAMY